MRRNMTEHSTYHTDIITVRALARMPTHLHEICDRMRHDTDFMVTIGSDILDGDNRVRTVEFTAWARKRLLAVVTFANDSRFVEGELSCPADIPDTVRLAVAGRPCSVVIDHPLLDGLTWCDNQDGGSANTLDTGIDTDIDLGFYPSDELRRLALAEAARIGVAIPPRA